MVIKARVKEWGNSLGVVIPWEIVARESIRANDEVIITIEKKETLGSFFGKFRKKIDVQKEKDESRKIWKMN